MYHCFMLCIILIYVCVYTVTRRPTACTMTVLMIILYVDQLVTIINDLNLESVFTKCPLTYHKYINLPSMAV